MRMPDIALPDILSGDGANVFMRDAPVDFRQQPSTAADATAEPVPAIKRRLGFLDDTWLNRGGWSSGTRGWPRFTRICVFDDSGMYGFGYNRQVPRAEGEKEGEAEAVVRVVAAQPAPVGPGDGPCRGDAVRSRAA
jgi:hypothetical protein